MQGATYHSYSGDQGMRRRREGAVHWNRPYQQRGHCLPQGSSPEPQQSLQNGYFGSYLTKPITTTFRDETNQTDLMNTRSANGFSILPTPNTGSIHLTDSLAALINDSVVLALCSRASLAQIPLEFKAIVDLKFDR